MRFGLTENTIEQINSVFIQHHEIEQVIIYGSRAKGNYKTGSDLDLTICGTEVNQRLLLQIMTELDDLLLPYSIDLSIYQQIDNPNLVEHIQRAGMIFYQRTNDEC
jgi:predicted nucleotidyltransferase